MRSFVWVLWMLSLSLACNRGGGPTTPVPQVPDPPMIVQLLAPDSPLLIGVPVTFRAEVSGTVDTWEWSFGEHATPPTSPDAEPTVVFDAVGEFSITLRVSNAGGSDLAELVRATLDYADLPEIAGVFPAELEAGDHTDVTFWAETIGVVTSIAWDFGGGASPATSTEGIPTVRLGEPGTYHGTVTVCNALGCSEAQEFDYVVRTARLNWREINVSAQASHPQLALTPAGEIFLLFYQQEQLAYAGASGPGQIHLRRGRADLDPGNQAWEEAIYPVRNVGSDPWDGVTQLQMHAGSDALWAYWGGSRDASEDNAYAQGIWRIPLATAMDPGTWIELLTDYPNRYAYGTPSLALTDTGIGLLVKGPGTTQFSSWVAQQNQAALGWSHWQPIDIPTVSIPASLGLTANADSFFVAGIDRVDGDAWARTVMVGHLPNAGAQPAAWQMFELDRGPFGVPWMKSGLARGTFQVLYGKYTTYDTSCFGCGPAGYVPRRVAFADGDFQNPGSWQQLPLEQPMSESLIREGRGTAIFMSNTGQIIRELGAPGSIQFVTEVLPSEAGCCVRSQPAFVGNETHMWAAYVKYLNLFGGETNLYFDSRVRVGRLTLE